MLNVDRSNTEEAARSIMQEIEIKKLSLVEFVTSQYGEFTDQSSRIHELSNEFDTVHEASLAVVAESEQTSEALSLISDEKERHGQQMSSLRLLRSVVVDLMDLDEHVHHLEAVVDAPLQMSEEGLGAVERELSLTEAAAGRPSTTLIGQESRVLVATVQRLAATKGRLREALVASWDEVVRAEGPGAVLEFAVPRPVVRAMVRVMRRLQVATERVRLVAAFACERLIGPAIAESGSVRLRCSTSDGRVAVSLVAHPDGAGGAERAVLALEGLTEALTVLQEDLVVSRDGLEALLSAGLAEHFLPSLYRLQGRHEVLGRVREFCGFLGARGLLDEEAEARLGLHLDEFEGHARAYEEASLLARCRRLCVQGSLLDAEDLGAGGEGPCQQQAHGVTAFVDLRELQAPSCKVSAMVRELMCLVDDTVAECEAISGTPEMLGLLWVVPELLTMYLSVVPVSNGRLLDELPQAAAMHYNNCMVLAHKGLLLVPLVRSLLGPAEDRVPECLFKAVYVLREAADSALTSEVYKQQLQIEEFFSGVDSFTGLASSAETRAASERAVERAVAHLTLVARAHAVLPGRVRARVLWGHLAEHLVALVLARVLAMADIVQGDGAEVVRLLGAVEARLAALRGGDGAEADSGERAALASARLRGAVTVLTASLAAIEEQYAAGKGPLAALFSAAELRTLVKALFSNSQLRSRVLQALV